MAVVIRYIDKRGRVIEWFIRLVHVHETSSFTLKKALEDLFSKHGLNIMRLRGQGYDGASNMQGEFSGLKALILKYNPSAFCVHYFAHQLQLALVSCAKNHPQISSYFNYVLGAVNIVGVSCKRKDILRHKQAANIIKKLRTSELASGQGLNQEISLKRLKDTRWGSHHGTLISLIILFSPVIDLLEIVEKDGTSSEQKGEACALLDVMQSFDFVLNLHLLKNMLGITNELSQTLQKKKNQNIVNTITLVKTSKQRLQMMKDSGWKSLLDEVSLFCSGHEIFVPSMDDHFIARGRSRRNAELITNLYHYRVELFYICIDMQLQELNNRFNELNTELLLCVACLNSCDSFASFDKVRLIRLARFYLADFSEMDLIVLQDQLECYILDVRSNRDFSEMKGIVDLAKKLVEAKKDSVYPIVYLLITLALILHVATTTVERAFSAMHILKNRLRNRTGDEWLNNFMVTYIEKDVFKGIDNEDVVQHFQSMKPRRGQLP